MADLDFAFLADFARAKFNTLDALSIGFDTILTPSLPASHQTVLALKIAFNRADCDTTHRLEAIVQDMDGSRLTEVLINVEAHWPDPDLLGDRVYAQAAVAYGWVYAKNARGWRQDQMTTRGKEGNCG